MIKRLLYSKYVSRFLDTLGVFYLASFLCTTLFLSFLVEIIPQCYPTNALIPFVECGDNLFLKVYFLLCSPIIIGFGMLAFYGIFAFLFQIQFLWSLLCSSIIILIIVISLRIIYKILKRLTWDKTSYSSKEHRVAFILLCLIFFPTFVTFTLKSYLIPPPSSERIIKVDLWHSTLSIQRNYLGDWSLTEIKRPEKEIHPFYRGQSVYPYSIMNIPAQIINKNAPENKHIIVRVTPHYSIMSNSEMSQKRQSLLDEKISERHYKVQNLIYEKPRILKEWYLYKTKTGLKPSLGIGFDIYTSKNNEQEIEHLLYCTPETHCTTLRNKYSILTGTCKSELECRSCDRICTTQGSGTNENTISFTFPKEDIDMYFDIYPKIMEFVNSRIEVK